MAAQSGNIPAYKRWGKRALWTLAALVILVLLLPATLYIPWVQSVVKDYACQYASQHTGMQISLDRILLKFPLDLSLDGVLVLDQHRDTMVQAGNLNASVAPLPLLRLAISIDAAHLVNGKYRMVSEDSSMVLKAHVQRCDVRGVGIDLKHNAVNLVDGLLAGGKVELEYLPYKVKEKNDTAQSTPWHIRVNRVRLQDVGYSMVMLPLISQLNAHVASAELRGACIDTGEKLVDAKMLSLDSVFCQYLTTTPEYAKHYNDLHPLPPDMVRKVMLPSDTVPWTVRGDSLQLTRSHAIYALAGAKPRSQGMDMNYIEVKNVGLAINDLYNRGLTVRAPIDSIHAEERGGLKLLSGRCNFAMDKNAFKINGLRLNTLLSSINLDAYIEQSLLESNRAGRMSITTNSSIALQEIGMLLPEYKKLLAGIPQYRPIKVKGHASGTTSHVSISTLTAELPRYAQATISGDVYNVLDTKRLRGNVAFAADFENINFIKPTLLDAATSKQVDFPPMRVQGNAEFAGDSYKGNLAMRLATGSLVGEGSFSGKAEQYSVNATFSSFPVHAILPLMAVGDVTASIKASGSGFDLAKPSMKLLCDVDLGSIDYDNVTYKNLKYHANVGNGRFSGFLNSDNKNCDLAVTCDGTVQGDAYSFNLTGNINDLDLKELGLYKGTCSGKGLITARGTANVKRQNYDITAQLSNLDWALDSNSFVTSAASMTFLATDTTISAKLDNEDTHLGFNALCGIKQLQSSIEKTQALALEQYKKHLFNVDTLRQTLAKFDFDLQMGPNGLVPRYMQKYDVDFREVSFSASNDTNIRLDGIVKDLSVGETAIDTITLKASEWNKILTFKAHMGNRPGTFDEFANVDLVGGANGSVLNVLLNQQNIKRETGYRLGLNAMLTDTAVNVNMFPKNPVIGYRTWNVNDSNYLSYNYINKDIGANLQLSSDSSVVSLLTGPSQEEGKGDILVKITKLKVEEWLGLLPFAPPITGELGTDLTLAYDGNNFWNNGTVSLDKFTYNGAKVGNLLLNTDMSFDPATHDTSVKAKMSLDGNEVATATGAIRNDSVQDPLDLSLELAKLPLHNMSAFIPDGMAELSGFLEGNLSVKGSMEKSRINGYFKPASTVVAMPAFGSTLAISDTKIPIDSNVVKIQDLSIVGLNDNKVLINGKVDFKRLENPSINLTMQGSNVQFVGSDQSYYSQVFGKGYADVYCNARGSLSSLNVIAGLTLLEGSNLTYVMQDAASSLTTSQVDENMVTFVNMNANASTDSMVTAPDETMAMDINAFLTIKQGAKINAYLSADGKDRLNVDGSGTLHYSLDFAGKQTVTGSYTIDNGTVRYSPPLISQKIFDITSGSKITWNGDMMNPVLDLTATEKVKTSVTGSDKNSRLVNFEITAKLGNTLNNMDLSFDLASEGDMEVSNELQSMTAQQRSNAAMNMLLYNTYSGLSSTASVNINGGSALYSFLQSQLNSWAASNIKGVDLTFGINQFDDTKNGTKSTETSYSYQLSKSLFDDRFKIVVGGNYSTDASSEQNFSSNLVNDVSIEYDLNKSGTKYVRIFRHTGFESVLEGEVTQMGVGYVMKRKISSLWHLFWYKGKKKTASRDTATSATAPDTTTAKRSAEIEKEK